MKYLTAKIILFIGFLFLVNACSTTKKVPEGEYLLTKNKFEFEGKRKPYNSVVQDYVKQKPNSSFLGFLPLSLMIYNVNDPKFDSIFEGYYDLTKKNRTQKSLDSLLVRANMENYVGRSLWLKRFIYTSGVPPILIDTAMTSFSKENLEKFYADKGYLDVKIISENILDSANKKAQVIYKINPGETSKIASYNQQIPDSLINSIYQRTISSSHIKVGSVYDLTNFTNERDRIVELLRNRGYYKFNESGEDIQFIADTAISNKELQITLLIPDEEADSSHLTKKFKRYRYGDINIYTDSGPVSSNQPQPKYYDTIVDGYRLRYTNPEMKYRPKFFTDAIVVRRNGLYRNESEIQTKRNIFKREGLNFIAFTDSISTKNDTLINISIYTIPKKKYELFYGAELSWSEFMNFGVSPKVTLLTRNLFGGGENLETSFGGTLGNVNKRYSEDKSFFNAFEMNLQSTLKFPYLLVPFNTDKILPKRFFKQSDVRIGVGTQRNIGLGRFTAGFGIDYNVSFRDTQDHRLTLFNTEYVNNSQQDNYFKVYTGDNNIKNNFFNYFFAHDPNAQHMYQDGLINDDQVIDMIYSDHNFLNSLNETGLRNFALFENMLFRKASITQNVLIASMIYQYTWDQSKRTRRKHPWFFRGRIELAGNIPALLDKAFKFQQVQTQTNERAGAILDVPYSQFIKVDLDVRKYFNFNSKTSLATRAFLGITQPYGNIDIVPFVRSYTAGGANDIRAWEAATLGPSDIPRFEGGENIFAIENMKLLLSAEYRFNIVGILNGAFFVDAGNIWGTDKSYEPSLFKFKDFYKELGIGSGIGFRFDLTYFLIRLDFAYKIHDPSYSVGNRWRFEELNILKPRLAFGINYPF